MDLRNLTSYHGPAGCLAAQKLFFGLQLCFISKTGLEMGITKPKISNSLRSLVKNISSNTQRSSLTSPILSISLREENHRPRLEKAVIINSQALVCLLVVFEALGFRSNVRWGYLKCIMEGGNKNTFVVSFAKQQPDSITSI